MKTDVAPIAQSLLLDSHYLQNNLQPKELQEYHRGMVRLGAALNALPADFLAELIQNRPGSAQSEIRGALSQLRPVMAKLPGASTYLKRMDELLNTTTAERIGTESRLSEDREEGS